MLRAPRIPLAVAALAALPLFAPTAALRAQTNYETTRIAEGVFERRFPQRPPRPATA